MDRVVEDAEAVLSEVSDDGDLTQRERKTIAVCNELGSEFRRDDLEETIRKVAGVDSEPSIKTYTERVLDRLDVAEHPNATDVFIPEDMAADIGETTDTAAPDAPAIDRKDYADLSRNEKIHGVRLELARKAASHGRPKARFKSKDLRDLFGSEPTTSHLSDLLQAAGDAPGYHTRKKRGKRVLNVNLRSVTDEEILGDSELLTHVDGADSDVAVSDDNPPANTTPSPSTPPADASTSTPAVTDGGQESTPSESTTDSADQTPPFDADDPDAVDDRMDELLAATPTNAD